jgi:hypothetical protein
MVVDFVIYPRDPTISGTLSWDEAAFAPRFVICRHSVWLWEGVNSLKRRAVLIADAVQDLDSNDVIVESVEPHTEQMPEVRDTYD